MNKRWKQVREGWHDLFFTPFCEEEIIATIHCDDDGDWWCRSDLFREDEKYLFTKDIESAKVETEKIVAEHYESQLEYYTTLLEEWNEQET